MLVELILRNCSITGEIPAYIGNLRNLSILDLSFNNLTGVIPVTFRNLSLKKMFLTRNMLSGTLDHRINGTALKKA
ncbi:hypothetical protein EZV62_004663 [Acer yangbiense]|uniref:Leucine-rich repeat-containing N-terminal plant-type domain-containing protein n=1 Tax=Acer yangbiense TaxID=1000413 RepID=A0A5C7IKJ7_9ROSI|nr:hypothetical protein EZV62_004663 [Acer yangbiense]